MKYVTHSNQKPLKKNNELLFRNQWFREVKGSYIEVYSGIEFPKHDFQFYQDTKCRAGPICGHTASFRSLI